MDIKNKLKQKHEESMLCHFYTDSIQVFYLSI